MYGVRRPDAALDRLDGWLGSPAGTADAHSKIQNIQSGVGPPHSKKASRYTQSRTALAVLPTTRTGGGRSPRPAVTLAPKPRGCSLHGPSFRPGAYPARWRSG